MWSHKGIDNTCRKRTNQGTRKDEIVQSRRYMCECKYQETKQKLRDKIHCCSNWSFGVNFVDSVLLLVSLFLLTCHFRLCYKCCECWQPCFDFILFYSNIVIFIMDFVLKALIFFCSYSCCSCTATAIVFIMYEQCFLLLAIVKVV